MHIRYDSMFGHTATQTAVDLAVRAREQLSHNPDAKNKAEARRLFAAANTDAQQALADMTADKHWSDQFPNTIDSLKVCIQDWQASLQKL